MAKISRAQLQSYLEDALGEAETSEIEQTLRKSEALRRMLRLIMQEKDRGEHSLGAIWCRERLSCLSREHLGSYLLQALDTAHRDYIDFHIRTIGCSFCSANLADLQSLHKEPAPKAQARRRRFFESSAGYLQVCRPGK